MEEDSLKYRISQDEITPRSMCGGVKAGRFDYFNEKNWLSLIGDLSESGWDAEYADDADEHGHEMFCLSAFIRVVCVFRVPSQMPDFYLNALCLDDDRNPLGYRIEHR
jgi:hypothetical protein